MKVVCVFTCFNRAESSYRAITALMNNKSKMDFVVVDDNSSDNTVNKLKEIPNCNLTILKGNGQLFYGGGMRKGLQYLIDNNKNYDYLLIINDDVKFNKNIVDKLINFSIENNNSVVVGPTKNAKGLLSYGGVKYKSKYSHKELPSIGPDDGLVKCDTFHGNCTLIPYFIFKECGNFDPMYDHYFSEFDYGLKITKNNYNIYVYNDYIGQCENNSSINTWKDPNLSRKERLKKLQSKKGFPTKVVYYYFKKNFNIFVAIRCVISPYIRILLKK